MYMWTAGHNWRPSVRAALERDTVDDVDVKNAQFTSALAAAVSPSRSSPQSPARVEQTICLDLPLPSLLGRSCARMSSSLAQIQPEAGALSAAEGAESPQRGLAVCTSHGSRRDSMRARS